MIRNYPVKVMIRNVDRLFTPDTNSGFVMVSRLSALAKSLTGADGRLLKLANPSRDVTRVRMKVEIWR